MSVSPRLSTKLHETLGQSAAEDLVTWLDEERSERLQLREAIRADFAELRQEMHAGFAKTHDRIHDVETTLRGEIHVVDRRVAEVKADLMKWSFVFWVGAVTAIAILAGVLR
jgi:hypothetical protein